MILTLILALAVAGIISLLLGNVWGLLPIGLTGIMFALGLKKIPAKPPNKGLVTIWGKRYNIVKNEGWRLLAPYFPFLYNVILIDVEKNNEDWKFENIRCKQAKSTKKKPHSGGEISVMIHLTWRPDPSRLIRYIDSGGEEGVRNIIRDMVAEDIRQMGRGRSWEEMTFSGDELMKSLVKKLTGKEAKPNQTPAEFQQELQTNGFPDIADLGVIITRLNVGRIEEHGELKRVAEALAKETQERRAEVYEVDTEIKQAEKLFNAYQKAGTPKTLEECIMEIRRRKAIREGKGSVIDIPGLKEGAEAIAGILKGR